MASKIIGLCYLTDEIFRDSAALEIFVSMGLSKELSFQIESAIINGDGLDKPLGIMNGGGLITVPKQPGQAAGTVVGQNIIDVWSRMWAPSRRTAVWLAHTDAEAQCIGATVTVAAGGGPIPLYKAAEDENQPYNFMLGKPVIPMEQCQTPGTPGDLVLVDWARYLIAAREARTDVSMHVRFLTDENAFRVVMRIGGQPIDGRPLIPFNGTNTVSPYVCIAARG
jgi:HK97 family phage major capsid protein